jgi:hypothetical protein
VGGDDENYSERIDDGVDNKGGGSSSGASWSQSAQTTLMTEPNMSLDSSTLRMSDGSQLNGRAVGTSRALAAWRA